MKLMVATEQTQGNRKNDFCWVPEDEIVTFGGLECDGEEVDGSCGCKRSLVGIASSKSTTTMKIVDLELTMNELVDMIKKSLSRSGWHSLVSKADMLAAELVEMAEPFKVGDIVERRGDIIVERCIYEAEAV